jgi:hypothetical protein
MMGLKQQTCKKCRAKMRFEFSIKDEIWTKLPAKWIDQILCMECFLVELEKANPDQTFCLEDFKFLGIVGGLTNWNNHSFGGILHDTGRERD